jgi:ER lumen protein retaining receptor
LNQRVISLTLLLGVSLLTQLLYVAVFCTRYLDLFWVPPQRSWWNFILKNFYIWSSIYIIILMTRVYARTREREKAWRLGGYSLGASLVAGPLVSLIFNGIQASTLFEMLWTFSIVLESVCVLPQLLLLRQTTVPTVIDSFYLVTLGSYRGFYILNWIYRMFTKNKPGPIVVIFGVIQTAFYVDFAWVYWTRQRVKLRGGAVIDSDDLRKGFLVNRVINRGRASQEEDPEVPSADDGSEALPRPSANRWGARGVSITADDTLDSHSHKKGKNTPTQAPESTSMLDHDDAFLSDEDDDAPQLDLPGKKILNSNNEWRDGQANTP